jgi:hypothetical protein
VLEGIAILNMIFGVDFIETVTIKRRFEAGEQLAMQSFEKEYSRTAIANALRPENV